jgi:hypothetical protein
LLELDFWADKCLFFPQQDLNPHHWYTAEPFAKSVFYQELSQHHYAILTYNEASKWSQWYLNGEWFRAGNNRKSVTSRLLTVTPYSQCLREQVKLLQWRKGNWDNKYCIEFPCLMKSTREHYGLLETRLFLFSTVIGMIVGTTM